MEEGSISKEKKERKKAKEWDVKSPEAWEQAGWLAGSSFQLMKCVVNLVVFQQEQNLLYMEKNQYDHVFFWLSLLPIILLMDPELKIPIRTWDSDISFLSVFATRWQEVLSR
jgi:hypothetical protein